MKFACIATIACSLTSSAMGTSLRSSVRAEAATDPDSKWWPSYLGYTSSFGKKPSPEKEKAYKANVAKASALDPSVYGATHLSDYSDEELFAIKGYKKLSVKPAGQIAYAAPVPTLIGRSPRLPRDVDWTTSRFTTPVKSQAKCGSCWAFGAVETIESRFAMMGFATTELSTQQVAAYTWYNETFAQEFEGGLVGGCAGGAPEMAYEYAMNKAANEDGSFNGPGDGDWDLGNDFTGVTSASQCPYTQSQYNLCLSPTCTNACNGLTDRFWEYGTEKSEKAVLSGWSYVVPPCDDGECLSNLKHVDVVKREIAENGPVTVCVDASSWHNYVGGIVTADDCSSYGNATDHCVQLVGYHTARTRADSYWIVRNSWSTLWGEAGHMRVNIEGNACGILNGVTIPVMDKENSVGYKLD